MDSTDPAIFKPGGPKLEVDLAVRSLTYEQIEADIAEYKRLLDRCAPETEVHQFLASHSYFFNSALRLYGFSPLYSKIRLGHEYEVDFAWVDTSSFGPEWRLLEIEGPSKSMFTKSGDPTADLLHAIQQVRNWHAWIHENLDYARKLMPHIEYPLGYVFVGRRAELTATNAKALRRLAYDHRMFLEIHTLDWFISAAASVVNFVERKGYQGWPVPMKALSHAELAKGLPPYLAEWLSRHRSNYPLERDVELRLDQRRYGHLSWPEEA
jgi:hypothetical protein